MAGRRFDQFTAALKRLKNARVLGVVPLALLLAACSDSGKNAPTTAAPTGAANAVADVASAVAESTTPGASTTGGAERLDVRTAGTPASGTGQATPSARGKGKGKDRAAETLTLDNVLKAFKRRGLPLGTTATLTAVTDPDGLLGTAGQYTAKLIFADTSLGTSSDSPTVDNGGAVEVFASAQGAARAKPALTAGGASGTVYQLGNVVLLLSSRLSADQVSGYEIALKQAFKSAHKRAIRAQVQQAATPTPAPAAP